MADDFDPSPRSAKRRRTLKHNADTLDATSVEHSVEDDAPQVVQDVTPRQTRRSQSLQGKSANRTTSKHDNESVPKNKQRQTPAEEVDTPQESEEAEASTSQRRSSGRERRRPRRFSSSHEDNSSKKTEPLESIPNEPLQGLRDKSILSPHPKSILTPPKGRRNGPRKSVIFDGDQKEIENQLGFKDIDVSKKTPKARRQKSGSEQPTHVQKTKHIEESGRGEEAEIEVQLAHVNSAPAPGLDIDEDDLIINVSVDSLERETNDIAATKLALQALASDQDASLLAIKRCVLSRLKQATVRRPDQVIPSYLQTQYKALHELLTATISAGESNSLLLLGARGSGKSLLIETTIAELRANHHGDFHTVHLNGFLQTDDKLALREIWRQLGKEMDIDEEETDAVGSYADTMASLLSLLSDPGDYLEAADMGDDLFAMNARQTMSKSVIFVLDEFDLFTTHPRQTLLYNLFDIAQSRKAPIAIVGCSTRMDVVECLEKRVKSRFSHRWLHVPCAKNLESFTDIVRAMLRMPEENEHRSTEIAKKDFELRRAWNLYIETSMLESPPVQHLIRQTFYTTKSIPNLFASLYLPIAMLKLPTQDVQEQATVAELPISAMPHPTKLLSSLPTLQLSLLVAAARLDSIHNLGSTNFNLVYDHYSELINRSKLQQSASGAFAVGAGLRKWTRGTAAEAWEDLATWHLIIPAIAASGASHKDGSRSTLAGGEGSSTRMWKVDIPLDELAWALKEKIKHGGIATGAAEVLHNWCRQI